MGTISSGALERPVVVVHSSDLHIDNDDRPNGYTGLIGLAAVLDAARTVEADLVLLAGDTFDNGRVAPSIGRRAAEMLEQAPMPVVLLPGNHDPAMADSMFHRSGIVDVPNARVIGLTASHSQVLSSLDLEIIGRPHTSYGDMHPLPDAGPRTSRWQIIMAHGHYVPPEEWEEQSHRSWRISDAALAATSADYVALGHWDRPARVGNGHVEAYYSGSPDLARTVNVIRLNQSSGVAVERLPVNLPYTDRGR